MQNNQKQNAQWSRQEKYLAKKQLDYQIQTELKKVQEETRKLSQTYDNQEYLMDYLYDYQLVFPSDYSEKLKTARLLPVHDWAYVLQITYKTFDDMTCPICLAQYYEMTSPHMTFCGHVFCLPCILRHLSLSRQFLPW